jgi:hypothetical protein
MASDQNQLNYWFGSAAPEMRVTMAGGGPGRIPAEQMLENIRTPVAANDPGLRTTHAPTYEGALSQQNIGKYMNDAHVGDYKYWRDKAFNEGIGEDSNIAPNSFAAMRHYSQGGKTTVMVRPSGQRTIFHNGERVFDESGYDLPNMMK